MLRATQSVVDARVALAALWISLADVTSVIAAMLMTVRHVWVVANVVGHERNYLSQKQWSRFGDQSRCEPASTFKRGCAGLCRPRRGTARHGAYPPERGWRWPLNGC